MKATQKRVWSILLALMMLVSILGSVIVLPVHAATVDYVYSDVGNYIYNWGQRDELATFLSPNAVKFYSDNSVTYDELSDFSGSTSTSSVPYSALFGELHELMYGNLDNKTSYGDTRYLYQYTDCENNGNVISAFYTGQDIGPEWDSGKTWNREHVWPTSKSNISGSKDNDDVDRETDIMMLRPALSSINSSRGNTPYGEGDSYYNPNKLGQKVRGDVARVVLYVYVCWGGSSEHHDGALNYMWGSSGVMESKDILLKWMKEDPVDTWEMGRNDSVEAITGTRNVFVDYPELAFLLFNEDIPAGYDSPSGEGESSGGSSGSTEAPDTPDTPDNPDTPVGDGTVTITFDSTSKRTALSTSQQVWEENGITVTNNKSGSTTNVADYFNPARFYKGSELIIAYPGMTKIEFVCNTTGYAASLQKSIVNNATVSDKVVTIELEGVDSYTCTLSDGQVRVDSITITYGAEECAHSYTAATCTEPSTCTLCGAVSGTALGHAYDNACDADCNACGSARVPSAHVYANDFDVDCDVCGAIRQLDIDIYSDNVEKSAMEMTGGKGGLAFKFDAFVSDMAMNNGNVADFTNTTVTINDKKYNVVAMGAIVTNDPALGTDADRMICENAVNSSRAVNIKVTYLFESPSEDTCTFAARLIEIPTANFDTVIYARPYCIIECDGEQIVLYGNIVSGTYNSVK